MRRTLPHLLLAILAFAGPAVAQIAMPNGVALSPFPVAQQPAAYQTFGDGAGGVWAVFQGAQAGSALYAQHVDINGGYALGFRAAARAITHSGTQVNHLWAAPDGVGGAAIIWYGSNPKDSTVRVLALRLVRFDAQGDIPPTFSDTGVVVSSIAPAAMVVGDGLGGCYVAWEENRGTSTTDIVAQHYNDFGAPLWTPFGSPTGRIVCAAVGIKKLLALHEDGAGGAYVVWADSRTPLTVPLYVMRLTPAGVAGTPWTSNGVRITAITPDIIRFVGSAGTPAGGLWLAWCDIGVPSPFAGQQIESNANLSWGASGAIIAATTPARAEFVPASSGDVFVSWGGADIRCTRLNSTGVRLWPESVGRLLMTPPTSTVNTRAVADGAGGQRLAWSFDNAGQSDVNILRVDGAGIPWAGEPLLGDPFATSLTSEEPVAWFLANTSTPLVEWLDAGVLRVRRLANGTLGVGPEGPRSALLLAPPVPNPLRGSTLSLRFSAPVGPARLDLFDAAGRRMLVRALFSKGGSQALPLDEATRLAPGVYTLRLSAAGRIATQQLVRVN